GKIIQELEALFRGAGWNVIKVIWGSDWDALLRSDRRELLIKRMEEAVDGDYQKYSVEPGSYTRKHFFGKYPELAELVNHLTDDQIHKLLRGGHDPKKVYAAYRAAVEHKGSPTVILAKTVKGYGLGEAGEGRNITHQQKQLNERELREFRSRFDVPLKDEEVVETPFYRPPRDSVETKYLLERRKSLGGFIPKRRKAEPLKVRTFGMDALFRQVGIYSPKGQLYEPVDRETLLYYQEAEDGQILEEGITEAGSMCSFIAAGTTYADLGSYMIPFYIFYSMFGFQRVGDLMWASGDIKAKGFLLGATAGRTTLAGEGLQHQDGQSHILASAIPTLLTYDPAFAYEVAVVIRDGLRRMYQNGEEIFYYLTLYNENYPMPAMPDGAEEGILKGLYRFREGKEGLQHKAHILGSGPILREALRAQEILAERYAVSADVWSATSYKILRGEALQAKRWNLLHPTAAPRKSYLETVLEKERGVFVAVSDYMKIVPDQIAPWVPGGLTTLGTDGFGRSDVRSRLRRFFEVDAETTVIATLYALSQQGAVSPQAVEKAIKDLHVDPEKAHPFYL
ncbi:MAG: pyruvate dehydrogenase (acetyl-transferring), homodimeric type, partial [Deltaproteobacteria bacterium]|nr:pyruvate dehydrogenase (acetyl-transferring), homodimeric type [Deltaproteobacteria bacterium]